jgi:hypothetical protein
MEATTNTNHWLKAGRREVYGHVEGIRFVARREKTTAPWWISLSFAWPPWERHPRTGWSE